MPADPLTVVTTAGPVRGVREHGLVAWRGIPYAAAPTGSRRYLPPMPPVPWSRVRDAVRDGPVPPQPRTTASAGAGRTTPMDEDCLTVSVVRRATPAAPRPVMVFVYGGAYGIGAGSAGAYRGDRLAARGDVVLVSFNYRLGALGWLDFSRYGDGFAANPGLRDQIAALRWVRDNIAAFGGDPDDVTLFGESAGGTSVATLLAVPAARGLFARAIVESATPGAVADTALAASWAGRFVRALGVDAEDPAVTADALRSAPVQDLVRASTRLELLLADESPGARMLAPVVDGDLLPEHPLDAFAAGRAAPVPLVIGTNADEGTLFQRFVRAIAATPARIDRLFEVTDPLVRSGVLAAYPAYPSAASMSDLVRDVLFWLPSTAVAAGHAAVAPTWMYRFDHRSRLLSLLGLGATHAAELEFVFGRDDGLLWRAERLLGGGAAQRAVMRQVQARWIAFARTGAPGPGWPRYDARDRSTLVLDVRERIEADPAAGVRRALDAWHPYR